mgnify:CR=1 FL=1
MPSEEKEYTDLKVDVGVLKTQVFTLSQLCEKMDKVIEKLVDVHDQHINQVYREMDKRRIETDNDNVADAAGIAWYAVNEIV